MHLYIKIQHCQYLTGIAKDPWWGLLWLLLCFLKHDALTELLTVLLELNFAGNLLAVLSGVVHLPRLLVPDDD